MKRIEANVVNNLYVAYVDNKAIFFVKENENLHDFAVKVFEELKTENENCKSIDIYPYGDNEASPILEYYNDDEEGVDLWVLGDDED